MLNYHQLQLTKVADAAATGTTQIDGSALDMSGYEGVIFFTSITTVNAGNFLKAQEGDTSSPSADLAGTKTVGGSNNDVVLLEIHKPKKRYIRCNLVRAGATTVSQDIYALRYGGRTPPEVSANVRTLLQSPDAGTP